MPRRMIGLIPGSSGTVTSVSGTTNQIDVATGTTTPVISLDTVTVATLIAYGADSGTANNIAIAVPSWWPAAPVAGMCIRTKAAASATGATVVVITPSGGSAYASASVVKRTTAGTAALGASGDYVSGGMYELMYDGTNWVVSTTSSDVMCGGALGATNVITGNSNNQITANANLQIAAGGTVSKYQNQTTAGAGLPYLLGATLQKSETNTADANVLTVTPSAAAQTLRVSVCISVASATSGVISWTLSYTDSNGNAQSNVAQFLVQAGTAAPNTTFTTSAAGNYHGTVVIDVNNAQANVVVKWVGGGTSSAKMSAFIERIQ